MSYERGDFVRELCSEDFVRFQLLSTTYHKPVALTGRSCRLLVSGNDINK